MSDFVSLNGVNLIVIQKENEQKKHVYVLSTYGDCDQQMFASPECGPQRKNKIIINKLKYKPFMSSYKNAGKKVNFAFKVCQNRT